MNYENQVTIFDVMQEDNYEKLLKELSKYGIDEYYNNHFKGKQELLSIISNKLEQLPKYREYRDKLLKLLQDYFFNSDEVEIKYIEKYDYIRIYEPRTSYPVYCLAMINKKNFTEKIKELKGEIEK